MTHSWIRQLFARPITRPIRKAARGFRPVLEALEDRWVPSTFTVNSTADLGAGSGLAGDLRYCINQANSSGGNEAIVFDKSVFQAKQTITLAGTQLELTDTTGTETITGPTAGVTVSGNNASRVFQVDGLVTAVISGLTISGGNSGSYGGGLFNYEGTATLTNCTVSGNSANSGGGVANFGTATLTNCTVSANSSVGMYGGGGVFNTSTATLTNCTLSGNSATGNGGGVKNSGTATLTNCTVSGNSGGDSGSP